MKPFILSCFALFLYSTCIANSTSSKVTLAGKVFCNTSKNPIASSRVEVIVNGTSPVPLSVANGEFTTQLPAVEVIKILAKADGYEPRELTYTIPSSHQDTTVFIEIYLTPRTYSLTIEGMVLDGKTNLPIEAELDLFFDSDIVKTDVQIIHDGKYREVVSKPGWYIIDILSPGYLSFSDSVWLIHEGNRTVHRDYHLTPIEVGLNVIIDHVYFYFGYAELKPESAESLNKIVAFLKSNPTVAVEIAGHTDDEGADDYNLALSQGRAEAIVKYLNKVGIESSRLTARGYGETKPIDPGKTKAAKAKNRRVEFTIVKK